LSLTDDQFDVITAPYDFRVLCAVTSKIFQLLKPDADGLHKRIKQTFNACIKLNDVGRVPAAHGTWNVGPGRHSARHVSRQTFEARYYFEERGSLAAHAKEAQRLMGAIIEGFPERPRPTATPPTPQTMAAQRTQSAPKAKRPAKQKVKPKAKRRAMRNVKPKR
jgi:hypothetical protein